MKKIIYGVLGLGAALLVGGAALVTLSDPNDFKPLLIEQVKKSTGLDLVVSGPIAWTFWPRLGLSLEQVALRNPSGFAEPDLVRFERGQASVAVLPLLSHQLQIGEVALDGAHLFIQTKADGSSNLSGLKKADESVATEPSAKPVTRGDQADPNKVKWQLDIESISLNQASALVLDDRNGSRFQLARLDLVLGELKRDSWVPISFALEGEQAGLNVAAKGASELKLGRDLATSELQGLAVEGSLQQADIRVEHFQLGVDRLMLDQWSQLDLSAQGEQGELKFDLKSKLKGRLNGARTQVDFSDLILDGSLSGPQLPESGVKVALAGEGQWAMANKKLTLPKLQFGADDLQLNGDASMAMTAVPAIRFNLAAERLDLDAWRQKMGKGITANPEPGNQNAPLSKSTNAPVEPSTITTEPDLSWLKGLDLAGRLQLETLIANGVTAQQVELDLAANKGLVNLEHFSAKLFGGSAQGKGVIDARQQPVSFKVHKQIRGVDLQPLLHSLAKTELLAGRGNADIELSGLGLSSQALRSQLSGTVGLEVEDGALNGINLPQMLREAKATLKGEKAREVKEARKTDFSALTASFKIAKGVASSDDILLLAPALRVEGKGKTELLPETLDFLMATTVVETSKGQGGKDLAELKGITIPVQVGGHWREPSYKLDIKALLADNKLLEEKARKEAERGLKKLLGDKAEDEQIKGVADQLLKGLFK
ncbi:AsmA family protein [Aeromonas molluscorum]|uniref:AsmA family protein n=1 Tax=Aeromonas molluscorum TaxID=271417 RepID=UPI003F19BB2D